MKTTLLFLLTALALHADDVVLKKDPPMEVTAQQPVPQQPKKHRHHRRNVALGVAAVAVSVTVTIHWGKGHKPKAKVSAFANGGTSK